MTASRVLIGLAALVVFCGPLCSIPLAVASPSSQDCHSKPVEKKSQSGIHACCQAGLVPSSHMNLPELPASSLDHEQTSPLQLTALKEDGSIAFIEQKALYDRLSSCTILRI